MSAERGISRVETEKRSLLNPISLVRRLHQTVKDHKFLTTLAIIVPASLVVAGALLRNSEIALVGWTSLFLIGGVAIAGAGKNKTGI